MQRNTTQARCLEHRCSLATGKFGKPHRFHNHVTISGAVHSQISEHCVGVRCQTLAGLGPHRAESTWRFPATPRQHEGDRTLRLQVMPRQHEGDRTLRLPAMPGHCRAARGKKHLEVASHAKAEPVRVGGQRGRGAFGIVVGVRVGTQPGQEAL